MPHIITSLCLRDGGCVEVCPVECIVPGYPTHEWPGYYIDPDTCIDCGACIPECPFEAIFPEDEVPTDYTARGGELISKIGLTGHYEGTNHHGVTVLLESTRELSEGEVVDFSGDIQKNYDFFKTGMGYASWDKVDRDGSYE